MGKTRTKFTAAFKAQVAQDILAGRMKLIDAARKHQIAPSTITGWVKKLEEGKELRDTDAGALFNNSPSARERALERENLKLKEKLAELYLQVDMLKKLEELSEQRKKERSSVITASNLAQYKKGAK